MKTIYGSDIKARLSMDERKSAHSPQQGVLAQRTDCGAFDCQRLPQRNGDTLQIPKEELKNLNKKVSYLDPCEQDIKYHLSEEKHLFDSAVIGYHQTFITFPVMKVRFVGELHDKDI
jgi:hypothetical protein